MYERRAEREKEGGVHNSRTIVRAPRPRTGVEAGMTDLQMAAAPIRYIRSLKSSIILMMRNQ